MARRVYQIQTETNVIEFGATGQKEYTHAIIIWEGNVRYMTSRELPDRTREEYEYVGKNRWLLSSKHTSRELAEKQLDKFANIPHMKATIVEIAAS